MPVSFYRYPILGAGMHHIIIALSAVAAVALAYILQEFRRRLRVAGDHGAAACPSPSKQNGRTLRAPRGWGVATMSDGLDWGSAPGRTCEGSLKEEKKCAAPDVCLGE
jgi:hypothetical protein